MVLDLESAPTYIESCIQTSRYAPDDTRRNQMKTFRSLAPSAAVLACALAFSCASAPPKEATASPPEPKTVPAAETPAAAPADKQDRSALDALRAKAGELRKKAFDLGLKSVLPDDYAAADKVFADGAAAYGKDDAASTASFTDAASRFQALLGRGLPLLAASERKKAEAQREASLGKKANERFASLLSVADSGFEKPKASEAAADYEAAIAGYRESTRAYAILGRLCDALSVRDYIVARDLAKWDSSNWSLAEAKYQASQGQFAADAKASSESAEEAYLRYGVARDTGLSYYASDRKKASETERERASGIKSQVAVKDEFDAAAALYAKAEASNAGKDYEASASLYDQAASAFGKAYAHAKAKMDVAKGELDSLDAAIATKSADAR
jgi:hypothetical protein